MATRALRTLCLLFLQQSRKLYHYLCCGENLCYLNKKPGLSLYILTVDSLKTFGFYKDEYDYQNEIFPILSGARVWTSAIRDFKMQRRDGNENVA